MQIYTPCNNKILSNFDLLYLAKEKLLKIVSRTYSECNNIDRNAFITNRKSYEMFKIDHVLPSTF